MEVPQASRSSLNNDTNNSNSIPPSPSSSHGSNNYTIAEVSNYDENDFHTLKFLDVAESFRISPRKPSSSYSIEFERLKPYLKRHISGFFERSGIFST